MGREIDCGTLIRMISGDVKKEANDNDIVDRTELIDQVLCASSAAAEKGLWPLAELFREWAHELHFGPRQSAFGGAGPRVLPMASGEERQSAGVAAADKTSSQ